MGVFLLFIFFHQSKHLLHGLDDTDRHGTADDGMTDVQLHQMGNTVYLPDVRVIDAVTRVDFQTQLMGLIRGRDQTLNFGFFCIRPDIAGFRESTRVQFYELAADAPRGARSRADRPSAPAAAR